MNLEHTKAKANEIAGNVRNAADSFFTEQGKRKRAEEAVERLRDANILQNITAPRSRTPINERVATAANSLGMRKAMSLADDAHATASSLQDADTFTPSTEEGKDMFGNDMFTTLDHPRTNQTAQNPLAGAMRYTDDDDLTGLDYQMQGWHSTPENDYWNRIYYDTEEAPADSAIYTDNSMSGNEELIRNPEYITWFDVANGDWLDENRGAPRQSQTAQNPLGGAMRFRTSYYDNSGVIDPRKRDTGTRRVYMGVDPDTGEAMFEDSPDNASWYIDNGTNDPEHRRSPYIQGSEILRLQDQGALPDLGITIDPYLAYDKTWLYDNTEFPMPWIADPETAAYYTSFDYGSMPAQWAANLTHHRELADREFGDDYDMTVDDVTVSGREFETNSQAYYNQVRYFMQYDPSRFMEPPEDGGYTAFVQTFYLPNANGDEEVHYGEITDLEPVDDTVCRIYFSDGLYEDVLIANVMPRDGYDENVNTDFFNRNAYMSPYPGDPSDLDGLNDPYISGESSGSPVVQYVPDMTFSDGQSLNYMQVETALGDIDYEGGQRNSSDNFQGDVDISYGDRNLSDVQAFGGNEFLDEEGLHLDPTMVGDTLAQSAPYMLPQTGIPVGVSQAATAAAYGLDPYSYNPFTGSYRLQRPAVDAYGNVYNDMNMEHSLISPLATAGMFLTERIAGNVGPSVAKSAVGKWVAKKPTMGRHAVGTLTNVTGEGVEENISGLTFEELQRNGALSWMANPTGDFDAYGNYVLDEDSPLSDRFANYADLQQRGNEFLGGAVVGGVMAIPQSVHDYRSGFQTSQNAHAYNVANGNVQPVYVRSDDYTEQQNEALERKIQALIQEAEQEELGTEEED